jgi:hypothetical protein
VWQDRGSASASEVLAGGLRDNCRALVAGDRSFGKGLIQGVFGLEDGSGLVVTVARSSSLVVAVAVLVFSVCTRVVSVRSYPAVHVCRKSSLNCDLMPIHPPCVLSLAPWRYQTPAGVDINGAGVQPDLRRPLGHSWLGGRRARRLGSHKKEKRGLSTRILCRLVASLPPSCIYPPPPPQHTLPLIFCNTIIFLTRPLLTSRGGPSLSIFGRPLGLVRSDAVDMEESEWQQAAARQGGNLCAPAAPLSK